MAKGPSGRLVVDVEPSLKRELHASLAADGTTFKEWVIARIDQYLDERRQPKLPNMHYSQSEEATFPVAAEEAAAYNPSRRKDPHS